MTQEPFEDFEIQREVGEDSGEPILESASWPLDSFDGGEEKSSTLWAWLLAIAVVALLAGGAWWWMNRGDSEPAVTASRGLPAELGETSPEVPVVTDLEPAEPEPGMPTLLASDPFVRTVVNTASSHPKLVEWLANDELIRRFTVVICNFAYDEAPALHVPFLRPRGRFSVVGTGETARVDPASYKRYDTLATVVASLDARGSVDAYRRIRPLVAQVYSELGYPGSFEQTLKRALGKVRDVPRLPAEVDVREKVLSYEFADPKIEALSGPQKQLLRMGPENVARIQAKANEIYNLLDS